MGKLDEEIAKLEEAKTSSETNNELEELKAKKMLMNQKEKIIDNVRHLLLGKEKWNLPAPKLIISVTGSAQKLIASNILKNRLKNGLIRTSIGFGNGAFIQQLSVRAE